MHKENSFKFRLQYGNTIKICSHTSTQINFDIISFSRKKKKSFTIIYLALVVNNEDEGGVLFHCLLLYTSKNKTKNK